MNKVTNALSNTGDVIVHVEAGLSVSRDADAHLQFVSDSGGRYSVSVPGDSAGPITLTRNGKTADLAFQGQTKDGIQLRATARSGQIDEF